MYVILPHGVRRGMASICLQPPNPFNFQTPDDEPRWKRRFQQFRLASGLTAESGERQVYTLLYSMGYEADNILWSTSITNDECKDCYTVLEKFDQFFKVRKNIIFERAKFNKCCQGDAESA